MTLATSIDGNTAGISRNSWIRTFQYNTSAFGLRRGHQGSAARIAGMRATSNEDKAIKWHHTT